MHVIGCNCIDEAGSDAVPERGTVGGLAQGRIDLARVASAPADIVGQIVRTGFDVDFGAELTCNPRGYQRLSG